MVENGSYRGRIQRPNRLAAMTLAATEGTSHAPIEGFDRGVEDTAGRVQMPRTQGVRITREACSREQEAILRDGSSQMQGDLMRLKRLELAAMIRPVGGSPASAPSALPSTSIE